MYTKIVVVVNRAGFLWITDDFSTGSMTWMLYKQVACLCMAQELLLNKVSSVDKGGACTQSVPVDIQSLIHRGGVESTWVLKNLACKKRGSANFFEELRLSGWGCSSVFKDMPFRVFPDSRTASVV